MLRYHKQVYFPTNSVEALQSFVDGLNGEAWLYSHHSIERLTNNGQLDIILKTIKDYDFNIADIFEYYFNNQLVEKAVFRIKYNTSYDIIFVVSKEKHLITVYLNNKEDKHYTLNINQYQKEGV